MTRIILGACFLSFITPSNNFTSRATLTLDNLKLLGEDDRECYRVTMVAQRLIVLFYRS